MIKIIPNKKINWSDAILLMSHGNICMCDHEGNRYFMKCDADDNFRSIDPKSLTFLNQYLDKDDILQGKWYTTDICVMEDR